MGLVYTTGKDKINGFVDDGWGNCIEDRRSYTGYVILLAGSPISWDSNKQRMVPLSSTEAEYMGLVEIAKYT